MIDAAIRRGTNAYRLLKQYTLGEEQDCVAFSQMLLGFVTAELWKSGWIEESSGAFLKAESLEDFITNRRYLDTTIPWIYSRLELAAPLDTSKDKLIAAAQAAFNHAIKEETGKSPKEWYEGQVAITAEPIPKHGANQHTGAVDNVNSKTDGGNSADYTRRRLARDRPDLLEKVAEGGLSLNQAAIEAGFRKKPTPFEIVKAQIPKLSDDDLLQLKILIDSELQSRGFSFA